MNAVSEKDLAALSRAEKMQILQWLVKDLSDDFPGIESRPNVCGGAARRGLHRANTNSGLGFGKRAAAWDKRG